MRAEEIEYHQANEYSNTIMKSRVPNLINSPSSVYREAHRKNAAAGIGGARACMSPGNLANNQCNSSRPWRGERMPKWHVRLRSVNVQRRDISDGLRRNVILA